NFQSGTYQGESDRNWYVSPSVDFRPASNVLLSVGPNLFRELTPVQYVGTYADPAATATFGNRYVFGTLHQTELSAGIRLNWTYHPTLSLQVDPQPLVSAGRGLVRGRVAQRGLGGRAGARGDSVPDGAGRPGRDAGGRASHGGESGGRGQAVAGARYRVRRHYGLRGALGGAGVQGLVRRRR